jgi:hypothetical protein
MKSRARLFLVLAVLTEGCSSKPEGCSSKPQPLKAKVGQPDPNTRHWDGTTDVLKKYRLPESSKAGAPAKQFGFGKQNESRKEDGGRK